MSDTFVLYVVDEAKLPASLDGLSDRQKYGRLVEEVEAKGGKWAQLELSVPAFADALETIDEQIDAGDLLPVFAFNNSPHKLLGANGNCPCFGYFSPELIHDLMEVFEGIPNEAVERYASDEGALGAVYAAFQSSIEEADKRGYALAVLHA